MTLYYSEIRALIDPEQTELVLNGGSLQHVSVIMTTDPPVDQYSPPWLRPAAVTVRPDEARELAFELLCLAEHAERTNEGTR